MIFVLPLSKVDAGPLRTAAVAFRKFAMKIVVLFLLCWMFGLAGCGSTSGQKSSSAAKSPADDHIVVMISLDGLAGYYLDDPKAEMPTLRELAAKGARASGMRPRVSRSWRRSRSRATCPTSISRRSRPRRDRSSIEYGRLHWHRPRAFRA